MCESTDLRTQTKNSAKESSARSEMFPDLVVIRTSTVGTSFRQVRSVEAPSKESRRDGGGDGEIHVKPCNFLFILRYSIKLCVFLARKRLDSRRAVPRVRVVVLQPQKILHSLYHWNMRCLAIVAPIRSLSCELLLRISNTVRIAPFLDFEVIQFQIQQESLCGSTARQRILF